MDLTTVDLFICTYHGIEISTLFHIGAALLKTSYSSSPEKALSCGCCHVPMTTHISTYISGYLPLLSIN